jgi:hypothetical protein
MDDREWRRSRDRSGRLADPDDGIELPVAGDALEVMLPARLEHDLGSDHEVLHRP